MWQFTAHCFFKIHFDIILSLNLNAQSSCLTFTFSSSISLVHICIILTVSYEVSHCARFEVLTAVLLKVKCHWEEKLCHWLSGCRIMVHSKFCEALSQQRTFTSQETLILGPQFSVPSLERCLVELLQRV